MLIELLMDGPLQSPPEVRKAWARWLNLPPVDTGLCQLVMRAAEEGLLPEELASVLSLTPEQLEGWLCGSYDPGWLDDDTVDIRLLLARVLRMPMAVVRTMLGELTLKDWLTPALWQRGQAILKRGYPRAAGSLSYLQKDGSVKLDELAVALVSEMLRRQLPPTPVPAADTIVRDELFEPGVHWDEVNRLMTLVNAM